MKKIHLHPYFPIIAIAIFLGLAIYTVVRISTLSSQISSLGDQLMASNEKYASTTAELTALAKTADDNFKKQAESITAIEQKLGIYSSQVGKFTNTVSTLEKLSKTDPQLLAKYSKVFFLSENYAPERLVEVPAEYRYSQTKSVSVHADVWPRLKKMLDEAKDDGIKILVSSGYRSFDEQKNLKSDYTVTYGSGTANQFSADQGYSEHQLGTTVDFTTPELKGSLDGFENTTAYNWLKRNAFRFGFILSYPEGNKFYQFEPWHWRFVGTTLANELRVLGKSFYDLDQRKIDEYLVTIFE